VTLQSAERLRVALLAHTIEDPAPTWLAAAAALQDIGHDAVVLSSHRHPTRETTEHGVRVVRIARLPEAPLRWRGFTGPLTHAPLTLRALARGGYDAVHAFSPEDAAIALLSRRRTGTPVVFTAADPLDRDRLADRRLRLRLVQAAVEESDAVTAPTDALAALVERWLAVDAAVLDPRDGAAQVDLYRRLLATRNR
jgi:hypothetical protein